MSSSIFGNLKAKFDQWKNEKKPEGKSKINPDKEKELSSMVSRQLNGDSGDSSMGVAAKSKGEEKFKFSANDAFSE